MGDDGSTESVGVHGNLGWEESNLSGIPGLGGGGVVVGSGGGANEGGNVTPRLLRFKSSNRSNLVVVRTVEVANVGRSGLTDSIPGSLLAVEVVWHNEHWGEGILINSVGGLDKVTGCDGKLIAVVFHMMDDPVGVDSTSASSWVLDLEGWWALFSSEYVGTFLVWGDVIDIDGFYSSSTCSSGVVGQFMYIITGSAVADLWATDQSELLSVVFSITDDLLNVIDVVGGNWDDVVETVTAPPGHFGSITRYGSIRCCCNSPSHSIYSCSQFISRRIGSSSNCGNSVRESGADKTVIL